MAEPAGLASLLDGCRDLLEAGIAEAADTWGRFDLPVDRFAERAAALVARRLDRAGLERTPAAARETLGRTARADLALAVACDEGVSGAWEALVARLLPRFAGLARKRSLSDADADALASDVLSELSMPVTRGGARTLLGTFDGSGSLFAWGAVILVRRLSKAARRASRREAAAKAAEARADPTGDDARTADDPSSAILDADALARFDGALRRAWERLAERERLALAYRYLDGVPQTTIAKVLGISEAHTSRLVTGAVARLRSAVGAEASGLEGGERLWASLAQALRSRLASTSASEPLPRGRGTSPEETP
jgi:RNA polymerase sigma factor (sigma-70 family)